MRNFMTLALLTLVAAWVGMDSGQSLAANGSSTTQSVSGGGVAVKVTYINAQSGENPRFRIVLDTHSVALDGYDLKNLAFLSDGSGKDHAATAVENRGSGHHREVFLTFPKVSPAA